MKVAPEMAYRPDSRPRELRKWLVRKEGLEPSFLENLAVFPTTANSESQ